MIHNPIVMGIASGMSLLLGYLLLAYSKKNAAANKWLGFFVMTLGLALMEIFLVTLNFHVAHPNFLEAIGISRFLIAPALYLAVVSFTMVKPSFRASFLWHFIPFLIVLLFRIPFFISGRNFEFHPPVRELVFFVLRLILPFQAVVYWSLSLIRLRKHRKILNRVSSSTEKIDLLWLQSFLYILLIILAVWLNLIYFNLPVLTEFTPFIYLACLFFLAHFSLGQREIFNFSFEDRQSISEIVEPRETAIRKRLTSVQIQTLSQRLEHLMTIDRLFLDNELSLPMLAGKLGASPNDTSYLINEIHKENFYTFINRHRIQEAQHLLLDSQYQKLSIIGIAYECGFNSKTAFNTAFKKFTGHSPTEYIRLNQCQT